MHLATTLRRPRAISAIASRSFFSLPPLPNSLPDLFGASSRKEYSERKLLSYSQQQLYDVVSDVDQYHLFVPWCTYSRVLSTKIIQGASAKKDQGHTGAVTTVMKAELGVGFQAFRERYVSEVTCEKPRKVKAHSTDSTLFRNLITIWRFTPALPPSTSLTTLDAQQYPSCHVDFQVSFEFASPLHVQVTNLFFDQIGKEMVQAFEQRCEKVYRKI